MIPKAQYLAARARAAAMMREAGVVVSDKEVEEMDVTDFGLSRLETEGAQITALVGTDKIAARVIVLFPHQTEPEHWHIPVGSFPGKEETLRVIKGTLLLYTPGEDNIAIGHIPADRDKYYTARHEMIMKPCDTITLPAGTKHWFQATNEGVVFYTISTTAVDAADPWSDPNIVRKSVIGD